MKPVTLPLLPSTGWTLVIAGFEGLAAHCFPPPWPTERHDRPAPAQHEPSLMQAPLLGLQHSAAVTVRESQSDHRPAPFLACAFSPHVRPHASAVPLVNVTTFCADEGGVEKRGVQTGAWGLGQGAGAGGTHTSTQQSQEAPSPSGWSR